MNMGTEGNSGTVSEGVWQEIILIIHASVLGIYDYTELFNVLLLPTC